MKHRRARRHLIVGALLLLSASGHGCRDRQKAPQEKDVAPKGTTRAAGKPDFKTTPAASVIDNIEGRIRFNEKHVAAPDEQPSHLMGAIGNHLLRAQYLGVVSSYGRAATLADRLALTYPSKDAHLFRARTRAALHDWAGAEKALEAARQLRAEFGETYEVEAQVAMARGNLRQAVVIRSSISQKRPTAENLGALAVVLGESGEFKRAEQTFEQAVGKYAASSPLPLVWLRFQQGLMWERNGRAARAAELYELAYQRFPEYAPLAGHLAANLAKRGSPLLAAQILEPIVARADDPQYAAQLGTLYVELTRTEEGKALLDKASKRYEKLLEEHPAAFADHAVDFYLGAGANPKRALELAELLVRNQSVDRSHQLVLRAAEAAGETPQERCKRADQAEKIKDSSAYLYFLRAQAYSACGRSEDATLALAAADSAKRKQ